MQTILITGANRGFGYEFVRQYAERGDRIFATCRQPDAAAALRSLAGRHKNRVEIIPLEVSDEYAIRACRATVGKQTDHLDILINNAGMGFGDPDHNKLDRLGGLTMDGQTQLMQVNAIAPLLITQALLDLLRKGTGARVANISSWLGSIGERTPGSGSSFGYSASKAALNMYSRLLAFSLLDEGISVVSIDPGWARTDMGGGDADQAVDVTVTAMIARIEAIQHPKDSGRFLLWHGGETDW